MKRVTVTASEAAWTAFIAFFPRCGDGCGAPAEVTLNGAPLCSMCVASRDRGVLVEVAHCEVLGAIQAALSPFEPEGEWLQNDRSR